MQKTIIKSLLLIIAFTFALSANYIFAVWTGPTQVPPNGNTPAPIHVGTTPQAKDGALSLEALAVFGKGVFLGNVGIGITTPSTGGEQDLNLDVEGAIGAKFYCDENGNNCASAPFGGGSGGENDCVNANFAVEQSGIGEPPVHWERSWRCPAGYVVTGMNEYGRSSGDWWAYLISVRCCRP